MVLASAESLLRTDSLLSHRMLWGNKRRSQFSALPQGRATAPINFSVSVALRQVHSIQSQQRMQQHIRTVGNVLWSGEFLGRVADAANAGNEDHADGGEAGHILCVVTRAAWHLPRTQSQVFR